ncbi:permease for cytosine/purines, uracil, thiamine, allantoin-domain-containing protein [Aspergillus unguis]
MQALHKLQVSHTTPVCRWTNYDIRPTEAARRTWGLTAYNNYWLLINFSIATYLTGSSLIPLGLNWWQAVICIVLGNLLAGLFCTLNSLPGAYYNIGFPVANRAVWGMWGSLFVICNRILLSLVWYGFNSWVGGTCIYVILQSWSPSLESHIPNTISPDTGITTAQFVAYIVFCLISLPIAWIRPHKLKTFFIIASTTTIIFFIAFLIWALATMGPSGFGSTISSSESSPSTTDTAWMMVYGIISTIGGIAAGILNQNDYARFARKPSHAILSAAIPFPLYGIVCSVFGILVTAATQNRFGGEAIWNPPDLLSRLITDSPTPRTRAACFFAGLALTVAQVGMNIPGNALGGGFDLAALFPKYINIRRGAYLTMALSVAVNPWKLASTSTVFLTVLSSYSVFLAPMTGIMVSGFLCVGRCKIKTDDLYRSGNGGVYWFSAGVNWRAVVSWLIGIAPVLPGFIAAVNPSVIVPVGLTRLYNMSYIYGFLSSSLVYVILHRIFPAPSLDAFVNGAETAKEVMAASREKWDDLEYDGESIEGQVLVKCDDAKQAESAANV